MESAGHESVPMVRLLTSQTGWRGVAMLISVRFACLNLTVHGILNILITDEHFDCTVGARTGQSATA